MAISRLSSNAISADSAHASCHVTVKRRTPPGGMRGGVQTRSDFRNGGTMDQRSGENKASSVLSPFRRRQEAVA